MRELKIKSLLRGLPLILILLISSGFLLYQNMASFKLILSGPQDLASLDFSGDIDGLYVTADLDAIYDWYAEEQSDGKTVSREYIIPAGDNYFIGLRVPKKGLSEADALTEAFYDYTNGGDDGTALEAARYKIRGTIQAMPPDNHRLYLKYLDYNSIDKESQNLFLPYYISVGMVGDQSFYSVIFFFVLGVLGLVFDFSFLISLLAGRGQKRIYAYLRNAPDTDEAWERLEDFLEYTPSLDGLQYDENFICGSNQWSTIFDETRNLVWIYAQTLTYRTYGVSTGKSHALALGFADGSRRFAYMKKADYVQEHMDELTALCPWAVVGYTNELNRLFRKNLPQFLSLMR